MNFHISVDFGSACCHNFRGSASISVAMTACSRAIDGGNVEGRQCGNGARGKSHWGQHARICKALYFGQKRELRICRSSSRVVKEGVGVGRFGPVNPIKIRVCRQKGTAQLLLGKFAWKMDIATLVAASVNLVLRGRRKWKGGMESTPQSPTFGSMMSKQPRARFFLAWVSLKLWNAAGRCHAHVHYHVQSRDLHFR